MNATTKQAAYAPAPELVGRCFQTSSGPAQIVGQNERGMMIIDRAPGAEGPPLMSPANARFALERAEIVPNFDEVLAASIEATEWLKTLSLDLEGK